METNMKTSYSLLLARVNSIKLQSNLNDGEKKGFIFAIMETRLRQLTSDYGYELFCDKGDFIAREGGSFDVDALLSLQEELIAFPYLRSEEFNKSYYCEHEQRFRKGLYTISDVRDILGESCKVFYHDEAMDYLLDLLSHAKEIDDTINMVVLRKGLIKLRDLDNSPSSIVAHTLCNSDWEGIGVCGKINSVQFGDKVYARIICSFEFEIWIPELES